MSVMRDFLRGGLLHWERHGESPCGARPVETAKTNMWHAALEAVERRLPPERIHDITDCPVCIPAKCAYFKLLRNGGTMQGWDIRPNADRGAAGEEG